MPKPRNFLDALVSKARAAVVPSARRASVVVVRPNGAVLERIAGLIEAGKIRTVIDTVYPLEYAAVAHNRSRTFRARGKLILKVR